MSETGKILEEHPFEPFMPPNARLLMCGTFPPPAARWSMNFYYPNYINDMWRIFGIILHGDKDWFVDAPNKTFKEALLRKELSEIGVALSDTGRGVIRQKGNASDKFLEIVEPIDLRAFLQRLPQCNAVCTTGEKAAGVIAAITGTPVPKSGEMVETEFEVSPGDVRHLQLWRMPSSSRAYPMKLEKKAEAYGKMMAEVFGKK